MNLPAIAFRGSSWGRWRKEHACSALFRQLGPHLLTGFGFPIKCASDRCRPTIFTQLQDLDFEIAAFCFDPQHVTDAHFAGGFHGLIVRFDSTQFTRLRREAAGFVKSRRPQPFVHANACHDLLNITDMPELPDISAYITALERRIVGQPIEKIRLASPFLLRTIEPTIQDVECRVVRELRRIGKRIAIGVDGDLWLVLHLMIAGRLHWRAKGANLGGRQNLAAFDFAEGSLVLTEAGSKHRAALYIFRGEEALWSVDPGGIDVFAADLAGFRNALSTENRTLKRALTDPRILSGIGNAYSDEILHAAQLSPITLTQKLKPEEWERLFTATRETLQLWIDRLRAEAEGDFPEKVTAFRKGMAVHGRYGEPCPRCGEKIQRIRYADNETNYCPRCQTGGKLLADRSLSRLMKSDWPRTLDELEALKRK